MEEYFPRGGSNQTIAKKRKFDEVADEDNNDLFKDVKLGKSSGKKRMSKKIIKTRKKVLKQEDQKSFREIIAAGSLVLGCIEEILEFELVVALPGSIKATVIISNISSAYTEQLGNLSKLNGDEFSDAELSMPTLSELFNVGMLVRCKVLEIDGNVKGRKSIKLSLNPRDINSEITSLKTGMVLVGAVSSIEDHGYVIDLGLKGISAFLTRDSASAFIESLSGDESKEDLYIGQLLHCMVSGVENVGLAVGECRTVSIVADPRIVHRSMVTENMKLSVQQLLPGFVASCKISQVTEDGLQVQFLKYRGFVSRNHLESSTTKYDVNEVIKLAVLYIHPVTKILQLTQLTHLVTPDLAPRRLFSTLKFGDILDCSILSVDKGRGVYLLYEKSYKAFCNVKQIDARDMKDIHNSFKRGSSRRCRVVSFNHLDGQIIVSCRRNLLEQEIFAYDDLKPAMLVECTIKKYHKNGLSVKISTYLQGFLPIIHLSEVPLKHPEKKFPVGKKLKCKVLTVNPSVSKVTLTHKKSLVRSKFPNIVEYTQCKPGVLTEGHVAMVKSTGLLVVFYNNVKGWVPLKELGLGVADCNPEKIYYLGQTLTVRVLNRREEEGEQKVLLSLKLEDDRMERSLSHLTPGTFIGMVCKCRVTGIAMVGLNVEILGSGSRAYLPVQHLSDHASLCQQFLALTHIDEVLENVMLIDVQNGQLIVTRKASLIQASINNQFFTNLDKLQTDLLLPGYIKKKMPYGMFVTIGGLTGLVPNKMITDKRHEDLTSLTFEDQSVMAKVVEVDQESKKISLSSRLSDCYNRHASVSIELLHDCLKEHQHLLHRLKSESGVKQKLSQVHVGQVLEVSVTEVKEEGVICELDNGVRAIITHDNMTGVVCKVGERYPGVVLHIDVSAECLQLTLTPEVVKSVQNCTANKYTQVRLNQTIKSEVQLITEDFVLVLLKGHASGQLAYLPAKRHWNDFTGRAQFNVGQVNPVVIKQVQDGLILASLEINEKSSAGSKSGKCESSNMSKEKARDLPAIGSIHTAKVTHVGKLQMDLMIDGMIGRVLVSEVVDAEVSHNPISAYSVGVEVPVRIIAYREHKTYRLLPITRGIASRIVLECSMKPSKLALSESDRCPANPDIKVGDSTIGYILSHDQKFIRMQISADIKGSVHVLNVSNDIEILGNLSGHFKIGSGHTVRVLGMIPKSGDFDLSLVDRGVALKSGDVVPGLIIHCDEARGLRVQLPNHHIGVILFKSLAKDAGIRRRLANALQPDHFVTCRLLKMTNDSDPLWNVKLNKSVEELLETPFPSLRQKKAHKRKRQDSMDSTVSEEVPMFSEEQQDAELKPIKKQKKTMKQATHTNGNADTSCSIETTESFSHNKIAAPRLNVCSGFSWTDSFTLPTAGNADVAAESDDDSGYEGIQTASGKLTKSKLSEKEEAKKLLEAEAQLLDGTRQPQSVAEFDRLVLQSPDSSLVWLRYLSFHLELTEVDKARAVAERALKTISFREEQEKLNVWIGYLSMENMFGTAESTTQLLDRATKLNDTFKVLKSMVDIYMRSNKYEAAEDLCKTMCRRFKHNPESWIQSFQVLFIQGKPEEARKLLDRSLQTVEKKAHIDLLNKFAQLEWKLGSADRAKTLFRTILTNYPKRTDLWSIYLDACVKYGDVDEARKSYEEVTSQEMNVKKLRFLFKKFIEFEKKHGTDDTLLAAKQKAINYADNKLT